MAVRYTVPASRLQVNKPPEQRSQPDQKHKRFRTPWGNVALASANMQRDETSNYSVIHLSGDVEIRATAVRPKENGKTGEMQYVLRMVVLADEANYDEKTGEIKANGNVTVKFEDPKLPSR